MATRERPCTPSTRRAWPARASADGARAFAQRAAVRLFTPVSPIARRVALSALPSFPEPVDDELEKAEQDALVATLVRWGGLPLDRYVPARQRDLLASGLNGRISGAERARYEGPRLSVETLLLGAAPGKVPLSVVYLGHISEFFDQALVLAQLCADLYRWMRRQGGSEQLKLLLYVDELGGGDNKAAFYPSYPHNPPSKGPLNLLVKQGRSAGVGVLLATQNPTSVDVRGLGNVNTWVIGKLTQRNDQERLKDILEQFPQGRDRTLAEVSQLPQGAFLALSDGLPGPRLVWERWLYSVHRQLSPAQVREIHALQKESVPDEPPPEPAPVVRPEPSPPPASPEAETMTLPLPAPVRWALVLGDRRWPIPAGGARVGRSSEADIRINDPHVSRMHVEIFPEGAELVVRALQTKNPTVVDGRALRGETRLEAGPPVRLEIGSSTLLLVALPPALPGCEPSTSHGPC